MALFTVFANIFPKDEVSLSRKIVRITRCGKIFCDFHILLVPFTSCEVFRAVNPLLIERRSMQLDIRASSVVFSMLLRGIQNFGEGCKRHTRSSWSSRPLYSTPACQTCRLKDPKRPFLL